MLARAINTCRMILSGQYENDVPELSWQAALTESAVRFSVPLGIVSHLNGLKGPPGLQTEDAEFGYAICLDKRCFPEYQQPHPFSGGGRFALETLGFEGE
jgi:hypothetical protein